MPPPFSEDDKMAEHRIRTTFLWKARALSGTAGATLDSDPIDMRESGKTLSVSYNVGTSGGVATCGSVNFSYLGAPVYDGTYVSPTNGTFATVGDAGGVDIVAITPPVMPFMKIRAEVGTSGTALVTAALHVR
jgi:hypothetical protein